MTDFVQVAATTSLVRPDFIINTSVSGATDRPALMASINIMGIINLLEAARLFNVSRVVHASSTTVYGAAKRDPKYQGQVSRGELMSFTNTFYGATKQAAEGIAHDLHAALRRGFHVRAVRFFYVFGGGSTSAGMAIENLVKAAVKASGRRRSKIAARFGKTEGPFTSKTLPAR